MTIDVLMPIYNEPTLVRRAIDSVPAGWNIIVCDDGSTDNTYEVLQSISRIELYRNDKNLGVGETLNKLYDLAKSDYYVQLSADDYFYPEIKDVAAQLDDTDLVFFDMVNDIDKRWCMNRDNILKFSQSVKFIKRSLLGDIRTDGSQYKEDVYVMNELLKKSPTMKFTGIVGKHYTHPKPGSLSYRGRRQEIKPNHNIREV